MKTAIFTFIIYIYFTVNTGFAQNNPGQNNKSKNKISLCNLSGVKIPLSEINKLMADGCDKIIYTDAAGKPLPLFKYIIAISPERGGNSYVEEVIGNKLSKSIKEKLGKLKVGDLITISQVIDSKNTSTLIGGGATIMYKIIQ